MQNDTPIVFHRRFLENVLCEVAREFPVVIVTGPRQSGKTTLLKHFGIKYQYVSLDLPNIRLMATEDPQAFIEKYPPPIIFDEIQGAPELLHYIKNYVDDHRNQVGQFLLSGSQNLLLIQSVTESLAGRAAILRLYPLSFSEIKKNQPLPPFPWEKTWKNPINLPKALTKTELFSGFLRGCYPELALHPNRNVEYWHESYLQTYLERDVRALRQIGELTQFQLFLRLLVLCHSINLG